MPTVESTLHLPFRREDVVAWLARPGALSRLTPPFAGAVLDEPPDGLADGAESRLAVNAPGLLGTSATAAAGLVHMAFGTAPPTRWTWRIRHHVRLPEAFSCVMIAGPMRAWRHDCTLLDDGGATRVEEVVSYQLPGAERIPRRLRMRLHRLIAGEIRRQAHHRERQAAADLAALAQHRRLPSSAGPGAEGGSRSPQVVAVSGASGMIGRQVCALLGGAGLEVRRLVRGGAADRRAAGEICWDPARDELDPGAFDDVDAVVHLAGHPLAGRFTAEHKRRIRSSRVDGTRLIARRLAEAQRRSPRPRALISGSAIGWYGATPADRRHERSPLTEDLPPGQDFLASVCAQWEEATAAAAEAGVRVVTVRTGIVQSPSGGALAQMLPLVAAGLGGRLGDRQIQSWISLDDIAGLIVYLTLAGQVSGPVNAVAPGPVTARRHARVLADVLRRPAWLPVPRLAPQLLLGGEGAHELVLADQRVSGEKAERSGYVLRHRRLEDALHHVLGR